MVVKKGVAFVRKLLLLSILLCTIVLFACGNKQEIESLKTDLKETNNTENENLDEISDEKKQEYINQSEEYRPKVQEMYDIFLNHYLKLIEEYNNQKISYDVNTWTVFLNNWNNELKEYRKELESYDVSGYTYNLFYSKNQLSGAETAMAAVWTYYSNLLVNRNDETAQENLTYFDEQIKEYFTESKNYLEEGD